MKIETRMTDLEKRLRERRVWVANISANHPTKREWWDSATVEAADPLCIEAADEIERLEFEVERFKNIIRTDPKQFEIRMSKGDFHINQIIPDYEFDTVKTEAHRIVEWHAAMMFHKLSKTIALKTGEQT